MLGLGALQTEAAKRSVEPLSAGAWLGHCTPAGKPPQDGVLHIFRNGEKTFFWTLDYDKNSAAKLQPYLTRMERVLPSKWNEAQNTAPGTWTQEEPGGHRGTMTIAHDGFSYQHFDGPRKTGECVFPRKDKL